MTLSAVDLAAFSAAVQDTNPIHQGDAPIVHAGLLIGLACAAATKACSGMVCARTRFTFRRSFRVGEEIDVSVIEARRVFGGLEVHVNLVGSDGWAFGDIVLMELR